VVKTACGCQKGKAGFDAQGNRVAPGTYRVIVNGTQVYESSNQSAAEAVSARFENATVLTPGQAG
jgi:hypothetical protein